MVQKASFTAVLGLAASLNAIPAFAQDNDDGYVTWGPDPIQNSEPDSTINRVEPYDVNEGPPGFEPIPTPQEFFESETGQRFLDGMHQGFEAFEQGVREGDKIYDFFNVPVPADEITVVDREKFTKLAQETIEPACENLTEEGLHGCTAAYLNVAGGFGDAVVGYITKNVPESVERTASLQHISRVCDTAITNISNSTFRDNFQYAQIGMPAARMCMVVTEDHGKAAGVGIDFLPSTREYVLESAQERRDATANFTRPAGP
jgi:hypothetical protein